ncbi:MAG TPA: hypothetical protein VFS20_07575 [Longimicrobium sp.]|nr:hypothetical protein [Longimicrobium sp.]
MQYRVIPFTANIANNEGAGAAAGQLQNLIGQLGSEGWDYVRLEELTTYVAGTDGCFGIGAVPGTTRSVSLAVFRR